MVALTNVFSNDPYRSAFALVNVVFTQRSVFYMQKRGQYFRPSLFPISFLLSDLPLTALNTLIYSLITYSMIGFVNGVGSAKPWQMPSRHSASSALRCAT
jgi:ABC-type multidrug transport system permease subunit